LIGIIHQTSIGVITEPMAPANQLRKQYLAGVKGDIESVRFSGITERVRFGVFEAQAD